MGTGLKFYSKAKAKRRIGPEAKLQIAVVDHLRLCGVPGLFYLHPCNEGKRSESAGLTLKRMGMVPGIADLIIDAPGEPLSFLELKSAGKKPEAEQEALGAWLNAHGRRWAWADNIDDALAILLDWGALRTVPATIFRRAEQRADERRAG